MTATDDLDDDLDSEAGSPPTVPSSKEANQWAMGVHLSNLAHYVAWPLSIAAPIVIWQVKKNEFPSLDAHGKNAVNWAISYSIYLAVSIVLCFVLIGIVLLIPLLVIGIVFPILAGLKANDGILWPYPLTIRFLK